MYMIGTGEEAPRNCEAAIIARRLLQVELNSPVLPENGDDVGATLYEILIAACHKEPFAFEDIVLNELSYIQPHLATRVVKLIKKQHPNAFPSAKPCYADLCLAIAAHEEAAKYGCGGNKRWRLSVNYRSSGDTEELVKVVRAEMRSIVDGHRPLGFSLDALYVISKLLPGLAAHLIEIISTRMSDVLQGFISVLDQWTAALKYLRSLPNFCTERRGTRETKIVKMNFAMGLLLGNMLGERRKGDNSVMGDLDLPSLPFSNFLDSARSLNSGYCIIRRTSDGVSCLLHCLAVTILLLGIKSNEPSCNDQFRRTRNFLLRVWLPMYGFIDAEAERGNIVKPSSYPIINDNPEEMCSGIGSGRVAAGELWSDAFMGDILSGIGALRPRRFYLTTSSIQFLIAYEVMLRELRICLNDFWARAVSDKITELECLEPFREQPQQAFLVSLVVSLIDQGIVHPSRLHILNRSGVVTFLRDTRFTQYREWWGSTEALNGKRISRNISVTPEALFRPNHPARRERLRADIVDGDNKLYNVPHVARLPLGALPVALGAASAVLEDLIVDKTSAFGFLLWPTLSARKKKPRQVRNKRPVLLNLEDLSRLMEYFGRKSKTEVVEVDRLSHGLKLQSCLTNEIDNRIGGSVINILDGEFINLSEKYPDYISNVVTWWLN